MPHRFSGRYYCQPYGSVPRDLAHLERLDHVPDLDVAVAGQHQTALESLADLVHVVLLAAQRRQVEVVRDHGVVAQQPGLGVAPDDAADDHATRDVADLGGPEDLPDLRTPELVLLELRLQHALQGGLDVVDRGVDDRVEPDIDTLALGVLRDLALRADVEADDDGVVDRRQVDVVLVDRTDTAVDHPQADVLADVDLGQRVLQGLHRTGHVALEDQQQLGGLALLHRGHHLGERAPAALGELRVALARLTLLGDLPGDPVVGDGQEVVARTRNRGQAEHQHRTRRVRRLHVVAVLVEHRPDPAVRRADHDRVADPQGSALHQHGRHRTTATVEVRLDRDALRVLARVGPQVQGRVRGQHDRLQQVLDAEPRLRGHVDEHRVAAVLLGDQPVLGQLATDLGRVRVRLVDLVHRDHDRHVRRLGVVQRLDRLRHHTVVGRDHQDGDVGRLGATGTHGGERLVTRGVDEGDPPLVAVDLGRHLVGADVLGDATGLLVDHVRVPDRVQQLGLTVVDVTHHGHHRRPGHQHRLVALVLAELEAEGLEQLAVLVLRRDDLDVVVQLGAEQLQHLVVHRLGRGHHLTEVEQHLDQRRGVRADLVGEVRQRGATGQPDGLAVTVPDPHTADGGRLHVVELLALRPLRLAATPDRTTGTPEGALGTAAATTARTRTTATAATGTAARAARAAVRPAGERAGRRLRHHRRVRPGCTRHAALTTRRTVRRTTAATRGRRTRLHLARRRPATALHALRGAERVVARPRRTRTRGTTRTRRRTARTRRRTAGTRRRTAGTRGPTGALRATRTLRATGGGGRARARRDRTRLGRRLGGTGGRRRSDRRLGLARTRLRARLRTGLAERGDRGLQIGRNPDLRRALHLGGHGGPLQPHRRFRDRLGGGRGRCGRLDRFGLRNRRRLRGARFRRRGGGGLLGAALLRRWVLLEIVVQATHDRCLDRRGCRSDELAHRVQSVQHNLAGDAELLRELVDPDLCHCSPSGPSLVRGPLVDVHAHRVALIVRHSSSGHESYDPPSCRRALPRWKDSGRSGDRT